MAVSGVRWPVSHSGTSTTSLVTELSTFSAASARHRPSPAAAPRRLPTTSWGTSAQEASSMRLRIASCPPLRNGERSHTTATARRPAPAMSHELRRSTVRARPGARATA
ncbi:hypothetical protein DNL40_04845 [Xylanimonas oleitrophica]|uniref:Uncharacterized protein n=1 Tax=Xylanimonas oleitrophica TaxID=2607479 RepID=A0A2W5X1R6_9MICO|nr:hypothetical protein DNL40_04845 [Xylanimonas oleitrophica]